MTAVAMGGPIAVVITLRADFYAHLAAYTDLRRAVASEQEYIGPMTPDELRRTDHRTRRAGRLAPRRGSRGPHPARSRGRARVPFRCCPTPSSRPGIAVEGGS